MKKTVIKTMYKKSTQSTDEKSKKETSLPRWEGYGECLVVDVLVGVCMTMTVGYEMAECV